MITFKNNDEEIIFKSKEDIIFKFNPHHDAKGRFSSADGAVSFTYAPGKSKAHDNAIARAKEKDEEEKKKQLAASTAASKLKPQTKPQPQKATTQRKFKKPEDLASFVKQQINETITPDYTFKFRPKKGIAYMQIPDKTKIWSFLNQQGIKADKHIKDGYFVHLV